METKGSRLDYIFTNAPSNAHNLTKREAVKEQVVLDGGYTCQVKIAENAVFRNGDDICEKLNAKVVVCGGDACVPPNPLAAYGATLVCAAAGGLVHLAVAHRHLNHILSDLKAAVSKDGLDKEVTAFIQEAMSGMEELKTLLTNCYETASRAENYFQWVQTLICHVYSLTAFSPKTI